MDAALFVRRPVLAAVLSLVILLLGLVAVPLLPVRETPDVASPIVTVSTLWPGADPELMETQVTEILEKQLNGIEGVRQITSTSQDQFSTITVEFELGRDLEAAANDVRSRVSRARRDLPDDVEEPVVEKADPGATPVLFLRLMSSTRSILELNELADTLVRERLQSATGVAGVDIFGEQRYAMRVELDPVRLAARGVTLGEIEAAFRAQNVNLPAGRVEGQRVDLGIRLTAGFETPEAFAAMIVRDSGEGLVRLGDVASIRLAAAQERQASRADGKAAVTMAVAPQANANIIELSDAVKARLPRIQADLPPDVQLVEQYDRAEAVRTSIEDVEKTLFIAFALVVAVIFAFLRDWRSTLVPAVAIPVSIVGTFFALWAFGFSINVFTLFGLVLAIGLVVDDAIVVLENVHRAVEEGLPPAEAASRGTREIQFAVLATTVSLVAVFLPIIFTGGTTGRLFLEFGTTVAVAVAISAVVALSLTPMLCALLLRRTGHVADEGWLVKAFGRTLRWSLRRRWVSALLTAGSVALGAVGYAVLPTEFFPLEDRNVFFVRLIAPEGTTFEYLDERMTALEPALMEAVPERRVMLSRVSASTGGSVAVGNVGTFVFPLVPAAERERTQQQIVDAVRKVLARETAFLAIPIQFPTVGRSFNSPVQVVIQHPDFDLVAGVLPQVVAALRQTPGLTAVNEDLKLNRPELVAEVDRERAAAAGLSPRDVARTLQVASSGLQISTFQRGARQYDVLLGLPRALRDAPGAVLGMPVLTRAGTVAPLGNFVALRERAAASARYHFDRTPSATISANLDGITLGVGVDRAVAAVREQLGDGYTMRLAGESRDYADAAGSLLGIFGLALVLVYLTLAAQFDSFVDPFAIMLAVPLGLTGAFVGLAILGMSLSFFAQVGLILLVGLVTKNGILIVEYARTLLREEGLDKWEAAAKAAQLRFRPILMTSIATVGGAVPIAVGYSGSSRAPLGVAVVAGVLFATGLTLYVVPALWGLLTRQPKIGALLLLFLLPWRAEAQAPTLQAPTLQEVVAQAVERSPAAEAAEARHDASLASLGLARSALLPVVAAQATGVAGVDPATALGRDGGVYGYAEVAGAAPVVDAAAWAGLAAARSELRAAEALRDSTLEQVALGAGRLYVAAQTARARYESAEAAVRRADALLALARERARVGAGLGVDVTRAELQLRRAESQRAAVHTAVTATLLDLQVWLGDTAPPSAVEAAAPLAPPEAYAAPDLLDAALAAPTPALRYATAQAEAAGHGRAEAARASVPTLDLFGEAGARTTGDVYATGGATVTVPLYAGGARAAGVDLARAAETSAGAELTSTRLRVEAALRVAHARIGDTATAWQAARAAEALSAREVEQAQARYEAGAATHAELVDAQVREVEVREAAITALSAYNLAILDWLATRGSLRAWVGAPG